MTCARCPKALRSDNSTGLCETCYHLEYRVTHRVELREAQRLYRDINVPRYLLQTARKRARNAGIEFTITEADVIVPQFCPLLGIELRLSHTGRSQAGSPSLDRIDPVIGYVPSNIQVISHLANRMKNNAQPDDLLIFAAAVIESRGLTICKGEST